MYGVTPAAVEPSKPIAMRAEANTGAETISPSSSPALKGSMMLAMIDLLMHVPIFVGCRRAISRDDATLSGNARRSSVSANYCCPPQNSGTGLMFNRNPVGPKVENHSLIF
jgi:hypothetical protein